MSGVGYKPPVLKFEKAVNSRFKIYKPMLNSVIFNRNITNLERRKSLIN
jgi:hypothetical protein